MQLDFHYYATYCAAILAGYGAGIYPDISEAARRLVRWHKVYQPNAESHAVYEKMYGPWRKMYASQLALADEHVTRYLWAAPGI